MVAMIALLLLFSFHHSLCTTVALGRPMILLNLEMQNFLKGCVLKIEPILYVKNQGDFYVENQGNFYVKNRGDFSIKSSQFQHKSDKN